MSRAILFYSLGFAVRIFAILLVCALLQISSQPMSLSAQPQPDFTLSANPSYFYSYALNWLTNPTSIANITATSLGGFSGTLNYTWAYSSTASIRGLAVTPFFVTLGPGQSTVSTLSGGLSSDGYLPAGNWTMTVTATSGSITHSVIITAIDGGVEALAQSPSLIPFQLGGGSYETNMTFKAVNFVGGTVQLGVGVTSYTDNFVCKRGPDIPTPGFITKLSSYSINVTMNKSAVVTLAISANSSAAPGTYDVAVSVVPPDGVPFLGTLGYTEVTIPGLILSNQAIVGGRGCVGAGYRILVPQGGVGQTQIFVTPACLDTALTVLSTPPGINATLIPAIIRNPGSATLKLAVGQTVTPGNYTVLIGGTSCGQTASTVVPLTVTEPRLGNVYWVVLFSIAGGATAALVAIGIILAKRRRFKRSGTAASPVSNSS